MPHFIWQNLSKGIFRKKRWFFTLRKLSLTWCACAHEHVHAHTHTHTHTYMLMLSCSVMSDSLWCHELQLTRLPCSWNFPVKNTEVGCHFLLQGTLLIQGSNPCLLHWQVDSLPLSHLGSPFFNILFEFKYTSLGGILGHFCKCYSFVSYWSGLKWRIMIFFKLPLFERCYLMLCRWCQQ